LKDGAPWLTQELTWEGTYFEEGKENSCVSKTHDQLRVGAATKDKGRNHAPVSNKNIPILTPSKTSRLLYFVLMQKNFKLIEIKHRLQRTTRNLKLRIKKEPANIDYLVQVVGISQQIYNRCEE